MFTTRRGFLSAAAAVAGGRRLRLEHRQGEKVGVFYGDRPLLDYRYTTDKPKPYVHPFFLPDGRPATLDAPADHVHHRGLMVAWSAVDGYDFWGEVNPGRHGIIVHQKFERLDERRPVTIVEVNHWVAEGRTLLVERRTLRVPEPGPDGVWLDWTSEFRAAGKEVSLGCGEHVYNGLGVRFVRSMDGGSVLNARGTNTIEKANGDAATWCAYSGRVEGPDGEAGFALFDHPSNQRHPNAFFVMNKAFGYLSAAPTFDKQPFPVSPGAVLRFRWGVLSFLGRPDAAALNRRFDKWVKEAR